MHKSRQAASSAFVVFLAAVFAIIFAVVVTEALVRRGSLAGATNSLNFRLFIGGPVVMAVGYVLMLLMAPRRLHAAMTASRWPHVVSAVLCIFLLGVLSIFTQGAELPFIFSAYAMAGAVSAAVPMSRSWWIARDR